MANVMELMREYKHLKQLKKEAGMLTGTDEARLHELTAYLQGALASRKAAPDAPPRERRPRPAAPPAQQPAAAPAAIPDWQRQKQEDEERQRRAQASFQVAMPDGLDDYEPPGGGAEVSHGHDVAEDQIGDEVGAQGAAAAPKKRPRPRTPEEVAQQLDEVQGASTYERTLDSMYTELYYDYFDEGYSMVEEEVDLDPIDPREVELQKAGLLSSTGAPEDGAQSITKVPGGVFLDEFMVLYEKGVLPRPEDDDEPEVEDPNAIIPGKRKVTVHMLNGEVKRGTMEKVMHGAQGFILNPQRGRPEEISFVSIKAVFVQRSPKASDQPPQGRPLTVEFQDRRRVQGISPDYQPGATIFSLVPQGRGNFERVIVNAAATASIG